MPFSLKLIFIILVSVIWVMVIPGYVAYKNNVFYSKNFKNRVSDSLITSRLSDIEGSVKYYSADFKPVNQPAQLKYKIAYSGFADNRLNFIWISTYTFLCIFIFSFYNIEFRRINIVRVGYFSLGIFLLFDGPNWFRNTNLGKQGRTIYSYVNLDIDPFSFWLQELRGLTFSILLAILFEIGERIRKEHLKYIMDISKDISYEKFAVFSIYIRRSFYKWQRDTLLIIALFLPWTWFYWKNITFYEDTRYLFPAFVFHSFWVISLIVTSIPNLILRFEWWKLKTKFLTTSFIDEEQKQKIVFFDNLEPYPKSQLFISIITTFASFVLPFLQVFIKK